MNPLLLSTTPSRLLNAATTSQQPPKFTSAAIEYGEADLKNSIALFMLPKQPTGEDIRNLQVLSRRLGIELSKRTGKSRRLNLLDYAVADEYGRKTVRIMGILTDYHVGEKTGYVDRIMLSSPKLMDATQPARTDVKGLYLIKGGDIDSHIWLKCNALKAWTASAPSMNIGDAITPKATLQSYDLNQRMGLDEWVLEDIALRFIRGGVIMEACTVPRQRVKTLQVGFKATRPNSKHPAVWRVGQTLDQLIKKAEKKYGKTSIQQGSWLIR